MSKTIFITSGKGGVGKTTITAYLAYILGENGKSVCIVDADIGLKNMDVLLGVENRVIYDGEDVLAGKCSLEKALVVDKRVKNVSLLTLKKSIKSSMFTLQDFVSLMVLLKGRFDYILVDSPAGVESGFKFGMEVCDEALVITQLETSALSDADRVIALLQDSKIPIKVIYNRVLPMLIKKGVQIDIQYAQEYMGVELGGIVYESEELLHVSNRGMLPKLDKGMIYKCFLCIMNRLDTIDYPLPEYVGKSLLTKLLG